MATPVILPQLGQTMEEATILRWLKKEGDAVKKGDVLLEVQTDKAVLEVESFASGTLLKTLAEPGETLPVLQVIGLIGQPGEKVPDVPKPPPKAIPKAEKKPAASVPSPAKAPSEAPAAALEPPVIPIAQPSERRFSISPRARR
ncbi:2-oxo acid dehydrogenase subunit E2, partial [bacterium]|nr:2-oxo acid dehydrogenase subunit E2 [bacterium]